MHLKNQGKKWNGQNIAKNANRLCREGRGFYANEFQHITFFSSLFCDQALQRNWTRSAYAAGLCPDAPGASQENPHHHQGTWFTPKRVPSRHNWLEGAWRGHRCENARRLWSLLGFCSGKKCHKRPINYFQNWLGITQKIRNPVCFCIVEHFIRDAAMLA